MACGTRVCVNVTKHILRCYHCFCVEIHMWLGAYEDFMYQRQPYRSTEEKSEAFHESLKSRLHSIKLIA